MCDDTNWRSLGEVLADVTERALMKAMVGQSGTEAWRQPLYALPPPQQTEGSTVRVGIREADAEAPASYQEPVEPGGGIAVQASTSTMPVGNITATMSREPPHRPNAVVVMFPMRMDAHLPRSLYLIRSTTQASAISASVPRS
jgi:hypothetical protein